MKRILLNTEIEIAIEKQMELEGFNNHTEYVNAVLAEHLGIKLDMAALIYEKLGKFVHKLGGYKESDICYRLAYPSDLIKTRNGKYKELVYDIQILNDGRIKEQIGFSGQSKSAKAKEYLIALLNKYKEGYLYDFEYKDWRKDVFLRRDSIVDINTENEIEIAIKVKNVDRLLSRILSGKK